MNRILVIDDDPGILSLISEVLSEFEVQTAKDGTEGLALAAEFKPELVIVDLNMPGMNGIEVCGKLKADPGGANIPVIMLTGMGKVHGVDEALKLGVSDYIIKPFSLQVLRIKVKTLLSKGAIRAF